MKKQWIALLCSLMALSGAVGLAACKDTGKENKGDGTVTTMPKPEEEASISFSSVSAQLTVGDEYAVLYRAGEGEITWATSNADVATVKSGVVTAIKPGEAKITASLDGDTAELTVKVATNGLMPSLHFENGFESGETISTVKGGSINFSSYVLFNTKRFTDMQVSYSVDNEGLASIDGQGKFVAKNQKGTVNVQVSATWRGIESTKMTATFPVSIITDTEILFGDDNKTDITLYTVANHGGESYATSFEGLRNQLTVKSDGQDCAFVTTGAESLQNGQYTLAMTAGADVAEWNAQAGAIVAKKAGNATLTLTAKDADGQIVTLTFAIEVLRPVVMVENKVEKFSTYKGQIGGEHYLRELFGGEVTLTEAYQGGDAFNGRALTVNDDNTVHGLVIENFTERKEETITVYDDKRGFTFTVEAYAQYIESASDLNSLFRTTAATVDGYFYLANDIPFDPTFKPTPKTGVYTSDSSVFAGVFEGNGHTVEYGLVESGLFGTLGNGAVIQNASFVVKEIFKADPSIAQYSILAKEFHGNSGVTLENVYASYDFDFIPNVRYNSWGQGTSLGLFSNANAAKVSLKNVVVDMSKVQVADPNGETENFTFGYSAFANRGVSNVARWQYENCYVFFDNPYLAFKREAPGSSGYATIDKIEGACYAENYAPESATTNPDNKDGIVEYKLVGVRQFKNHGEAKGYFADNGEALQALRGFTDTSLGFPVADATAHVRYYTDVKVNGEDTAEVLFDAMAGGSATLSLHYEGQSLQGVQITHASGIADLVEIEGATVTYAAGAVGQEVLTVSAVVNGVTVEKTVTVTVQAQDLGVIYYDTDGTLPASLNGVTVGKIVSAADPTNVYYDGSTWRLAVNTANEIVEYDAIVFNDAGAVAGSAKIQSVAKVIETEKDLESLYGGSASAPVKGYYLVVNDIVDDPAFTPAPAEDSYFAGIFDGNGKKIEYTLKANGLLGTITANAQVKNVSLIVKGVPTTAVKAAYSILAYEIEINSTNVLFENIYATYDIENFTPDVSFNSWGTTSGVGLFEYTRSGKTGVTLKNVIVDLSKVIIADPTNETSNFTHGYGAIAARGQTFNGSDTYWTYQNVHVIFDNPYVNFKRDVKKPEYSLLQEVAQYTLGIGESSTLTAVNVMKPSGLKHYNNYAAVTETVKVGSFVISSEGVTKA